jgi:hypothetical protein
MKRSRYAIQLSWRILSVSGDVVDIPDGKEIVCPSGLWQVRSELVEMVLARALAELVSTKLGIAKTGLTKRVNNPAKLARRPNHNHRLVRLSETGKRRRSNSLVIMVGCILLLHEYLHR